MSEMKPGRELDALVAERVMGWTPTCSGAFQGNPLGGMSDPSGWCKECGAEWGPGWTRLASHPRPLPHYSTSIEAAWEVVEKIRNRKDSDGKSRWYFNLCDNPFEFECCFIYRPEGGGSTQCRANGETAPHAICLAALRAVGAI